QRRLQVIRQSPAAFSLLFGKAHTGERCQPAGAKALLDAVAMVRRDQAMLVDGAQEAAVDAGEPLLVDLPQVGPHDLAVGAWAQVEVHKLGSPASQPVRDILAGDDQVLAPVVLSPDQHVAMRMARVEMV